MKEGIFMVEDTIAAIATAYGEGGIGIVRMSGERSLEILNQIFVPGSLRGRAQGHSQGLRSGQGAWDTKRGMQGEDRAQGEGRHGEEDAPILPESLEMTNEKPIVNRRLTYGSIVDPRTERLVDEVLAVYMKAPCTYTAEDVVEINCHGSVVALRNVLSLCLERGARLAEPGEFTKRAFLNGRIDLSQAEAVIDVIRAKTDKGFDVALGQMEGRLSQEIRSIREELMDLLVQVTVNLDYPDEDIEELTYEKLIKCASSINDKLETMLAGAHTGRMIREGLAVTITGRPNVGKSSLMNAFLKESRAIVTEIPGTTRDTIEEVLSVCGIPVRLTDTAGIRSTEDKIERIGIEKSKEAVNKADLVLFMLSGNEDFTEEDLEIMPYLDVKRTIVLLNKRDLGAVLTKPQVEERLPGVCILETSMIDGEGISLLEDKIKEMVYGGRVSQGESVMVTNARHTDLIRRAGEEVYMALDMAESRQALDFIEINLRQAFDCLGEIIGETAVDQIIDQVFSRFCLGK